MNNKPVFFKPKHAAVSIEPEAPRARAKWGNLHAALAQLLEARALAFENSEPAEALGAASDLIDDDGVAG